MVSLFWWWKVNGKLNYKELFYVVSFYTFKEIFEDVLDLWNASLETWIINTWDVFFLIFNNLI